MTNGAWWLAATGFILSIPVIQRIKWRIEDRRWDRFVDQWADRHEVLR